MTPADYRQPGAPTPHAFRPGDLVVKNPLTWLPSDFDAWAGVGIGVVVEPPFPPGDGEVDVRWPGGRCFQKAFELLPVPPDSPPPAPIG